MSKLSSDEKVQIAFSKEPTAVLAKEYKLCRTTPSDIKNDAKRIVKHHYDTQKMGRPSENIDERDLIIEKLKKENKNLVAEIKLKDEMALLAKKLAKEVNDVKKKN